MKAPYSIILALIFLAIIAPAQPLEARTWYILPDGTGDAPTIQAGVDSAVAGDTILLASGTFTGVGNRDVNFYGKEVTVRSASGDPQTCIIDCQEAGRGFAFLTGEGPAAVLEGLTITRGASSPGGAIRIWSDASPTIRNCFFQNNSADMIGGAICIVIRAAPTLENCTFEGNSSTFGGAVICWVDAEPIITGCTFIENSAAFGGAIECADRAIATIDSCVFIRNTAVRGGAVMSEESGQVILKQCTFFVNEAEESGAGICCEVDGHAYVENTIIAFSTLGDAVFCTSSSSATLTCCDVYQNAGGDWVGYIADQLGQNGNICLDPLFCDAENGDFSLMEGSPCLPDFNADCGLIGAHGQGCAATPVIESARMDKFLSLCYPNPFNPSTTIRFSLPTALPIQLSIYTLGGKQLATLLHESMPPGPHSVTWNGTDDKGRAVASGTYIYRLEAGEYVESKRMLLVR